MLECGNRTLNLAIRWSDTRSVEKAQNVVQIPRPLELAQQQCYRRRLLVDFLSKIDLGLGVFSSAQRR